MFLDLEKGEEYKVIKGVRIRPIYYTDDFMAILFIIEEETPVHKHINTQFGVVLDRKAIFRIRER